jgi:hypothetical protein
MSLPPDTFQLCLREADVQALHCILRLDCRRLLVQSRGLVDPALAEEQDQAICILDAGDRRLRIEFDCLREMVECCILLRAISHSGDNAAHLVEHFGLVGTVCGVCIGMRGR